MSLIDKMKEQGKNKDKDVSVEKQYEELMKSMTPEKKIILNFKQTGSRYWGKLGKARVTPIRESKKGTKYYLLIADTIKEGEKRRLLQEWFIGADGNAKPASKKNIVFSEDLCDEIGSLIMEPFEME